MNTDKNLGIETFPPLYTAYQRLSDDGYSGNDIGYMVLESVLRHATLNETMRKKNNGKFCHSELKAIRRTLERGYIVDDLSTRVDHLFNDKSWRGVRKIFSFADAASYLYLDRNESERGIGDYFTNERVVRGFDYDFVEGVDIAELDISESEKNRRSYFSALRQLGVHIQDEWNVIVLPGNFGK